MKHCAHALKPLGKFVVLCTDAEAQKFFGQRAHVLNCAICDYCRPDPTSSIGMNFMEAGRPEPVEGPSSRRPGLGDRVEKILKPIARAIKSDCLDEHDGLKPGSPCHKGREFLNTGRWPR